MKKYFLELISVVCEGGNAADPNPYVDIHISDYNFKKVKKLKNLSPLRWVKAIDSVIYPGHGEGKLVIGKYTFDIVYAWGGRNKPGKPFDERTSFTVRLEGQNIVEVMPTILNTIIADENKGELTYEISTKEWNKRLGWPTLKKFLVWVKELNQYLKEESKPLRNTDEMVKTYQDQIRENLPVTLYYQMKRIETDLL